MIQARCTAYQASQKVTRRKKSRDGAQAKSGGLVKEVGYVFHLWNIVLTIATVF
jgi:hypothetical protein